MTPGTVAHQAPLSMGFPRQEYWSGLPWPSLGDFLHQGIKPMSLALAGRLFTTEPLGKPKFMYTQMHKSKLHNLMRCGQKKEKIQLSRYETYPCQDMRHFHHPIKFPLISSQLPVKWSEVKSFSHVWLFATPWTVAYQAPPSLGFSRQEYWSGLPFPSPGCLSDPGIKPGFPAL